MILTGCYTNHENDAENAKENGKEKQYLKDARVKYDNEWKQFKSDAELKISKNEKSIEEFKVQASKAGTKLKSDYEKKVVLLEEKNAELKKKISLYRYEGEVKWEEFKKDFNKDMNIVGNAINELFTKKD